MPNSDLEDLAQATPLANLKAYLAGKACALDNIDPIGFWNQTKAIYGCPTRTRTFFSGYEDGVECLIKK